MEMQIYYEDTDSGGIVYHGNYLKFCERVRSNIFFKQNRLPYTNEGSFVVHSLEAKYLSPLRLGDRIRVCLEVLEERVSMMLIRHRIFKIFDMQAQKNTQQEVFFMDAKIVYVVQNKIKKIPQELRGMIHEASSN